MLKRTLVLLFAVITVFMMTACAQTEQTDQAEDSTVQTSQDSASEPTEVSTSDEEVTITVWTFLDPTGTDGRSRVLKQAMDMYEEAYPMLQSMLSPNNGIQ